MTPDLTFLQRCAAFCRAHGAPHYYRDWSPLVLLEYLNFHAQQQTVQVVEDAQGIAGVAFGFRWRERDLRQNLGEGKPLFQWQRDDAHGDCLLLGHFIVRPDARGGEILAELVRKLTERFPDWRRLKLFTLRRRHGAPHQFREYPARVADLILKTERAIA